jgi:hypothetical protein
MTVCGECELIKTFLLPSHVPKGGVAAGLDLLVHVTYLA